MARCFGIIQPYLSLLVRSASNTFHLISKLVPSTSDPGYIMVMRYTPCAIRFYSFLITNEFCMLLTIACFLTLIRNIKLLISIAVFSFILGVFNKLHSRGGPHRLHFKWRVGNHWISYSKLQALL